MGEGGQLTSSNHRERQTRNRAGLGDDWTLGSDLIRAFHLLSDVWGDSQASMLRIMATGSSDLHPDSLTLENEEKDTSVS